MRAFDLATVMQLAQFHVAAFAETGQVKDQAAFLEMLRSFRDPVETLGLTSTLRQLHRVIYTLERVEPSDGPTAKWRAIQADMQQLGVRFQEETEAIVAFAVPERDYRLYEDPTRDWQSILAKFPSCRSDVEEMNRCLALGRYTAAVFHGMCVIEPGLTALAARFSVLPAGSDSWAKIVDQIRDRIQAESKAKGNRWPDQSYFAQAAIEVWFFKDAWRNHVMHSRAAFDRERAAEVVVHVRRFMEHLARQLSEAEASP